MTVHTLFILGPLTAPHSLLPLSHTSLVSVSSWFPSPPALICPFGPLSFIPLVKQVSSDASQLADAGGTEMKGPWSPIVEQLCGYQSSMLKVSRELQGPGTIA